MKNDLISVILPVHNGERYLKSAIESVLSQSYSFLELIVIDDHSDDGSLEIATEFAKLDSRVKIIQNSRNRKLPASLNIGHRQAKGGYLTWTSDDNIYQKDALEKMLETLVQKGVDVVYADYSIIDEKGSLVDKTILKPIEFLLFYGVIGACFLYKKEVFWKNEGYREDLFLVEDHDFWLRAQKNFLFYKIQNSGYYFYRRHEKSLTHRIKNEAQLKEIFFENKQRAYHSHFKQLNLKNEEIIIRFLLLRFEEGPYATLLPITTPGFFSDLNIVAKHFRNFSPINLRNFILNDCLETILRNSRHQTFSVLLQLHIAAKKDILNLSIKRYLALIKKCILGSFTFGKA